MSGVNIDADILIVIRALPELEEVEEVWDPERKEYGRIQKKEHSGPDSEMCSVVLSPFKGTGSGLTKSGR